MADIYQRERAQSVATLADQLKKNRQQSQGLVRGPGGLLQQLTGAGIQQLSEARGLETPPTTPLGGQAIGATPDQVKMLGDARQKRAALDIGTTGGLAEAKRVKQARTETTATEEKTFAKSESLQKLGSVGQQAGQLIDAATSDLTKMAPTAVSLSDKGKELTDEQKKLLTDYVTSGTGPEGLNKLATALGVSPSALDISQYLSADILTGETRDKLAKDLAAIAPDSVTLGQLYPNGVAESLGISETELASLGLDPGSLSGLTVSGLQDFLSQKQTELFAEPQSVRSSLSDPTLSTAERDELREQLRGLSSAGVLGVEQAVADLVTQIEAADQVTYTDPDTGNLVSRPIGDLLADEGMTGLVTGFLGLTPEKQKELLADTANPLANLYKWISKNRDNLTALTSGAIVSAEAEQKLVKDNIELANVQGFQVPNEVMSVIFGTEWNTFGVGKLDQTKPLYQLIVKASNPKEVIDLLKAVPANTLKQLNNVPANKLTTQLIQQASKEASSLSEMTKLVDSSGNPTDFLKFEEQLNGLLSQFGINIPDLGKLKDLVSLGLLKDPSGLINLLSGSNYRPSPDSDAGKIGSIGKGVAAKLLKILTDMSAKLDTGSTVKTQVTTAMPTGAIKENKLILDAHNSYVGKKLRQGNSITSLLADSSLEAIKNWEINLKLLTEKTGKKEYRDAYAQIQVLRTNKEASEKVTADTAAATAADIQSRASTGRQTLSSGTYTIDQLPSIYDNITASWSNPYRGILTSQQFQTIVQSAAPGQSAIIANIMKYPEYAEDLRKLEKLSKIHPKMVPTLLQIVEQRRASGKLISAAYLREIVNDPVEALRNIRFDGLGLRSDGSGGYYLRHGG